MTRPHTQIGTTAQATPDARQTAATPARKLKSISEFQFLADNIRPHTNSNGCAPIMFAHSGAFAKLAVAIANH